MKARWIFSLLSSLLLVGLTFLEDRLQYNLGGEGGLMRKMEALRDMTGNQLETTDGSDDFFAVNIGFDRELVDAYDEYGIEVGKRAIVNRKSLADFLTLLEKTDYKAILLDVMFYSEDKTDSDSLLFSLINRMPRVLAVTDGSAEITTSINLEKLTIAQYGITIDENNFVKYHYEDEKIPDIALASYNLVSDKKINFSKWFSPQDKGLVTNSVFLSMPIRIESFYNEEGEKILFNLEKDILDVYSSEDIAELVKGKTIIVGDFTGGDNHDTYVGSIPGSVIIMNAIKALEQKRFIISWWEIVLMFIVYLLAVMFIVTEPARLLPWGLAESTLWRFLTTFIGFSVILVAMNIAVYFLTGNLHDLWLPSIYLTIVYFICEHDLYTRIRLCFQKRSKK